MIDKDTGKARGYGFVTYDSSEAVDKVTQNRYVPFKGKTMEIKRAEPRGQQQKNLNQGGMSQMNNMGNNNNMPNIPNVQQFQQNMMGNNNNNNMNGMGNMQQYWQQMQQMQQYWMQMQQMQNGGNTAVRPKF
ncbi:unnamed protein product [[Candida] boidinii]|nr:unnamed protein product [[Candida] boidinii]